MKSRFFLKSASKMRGGERGTRFALRRRMFVGPKVIGACSLVTFALVSLPREGKACAAPSCAPARLGPSEGATIPSNAPALPYVASSSMGANPPGTTFRLLRPGMVEVPSTAAPDAWWPTGELLTTGTTLAAGAGYAVVYKESCTFGGQSPEGKRTFNVGAPSALPTKTGVLRGMNREVGSRTVETGSGSCISTIDAVSADLVVEPTPELLAYAGVTGFDLHVDGAKQPYRRFYYGSSEVVDGKLVVGRLHAACGTRAQYDDNGLTLGIHELEIVPHVAGAAGGPAPARVRLNFSCTDTTLEVETIPEDVDPDEKVNRADAGPATSETANPTSPPSDPTATAGCACDMAQRRTAPGGMVAAIGLALAALGRQRRREH